jgi:hypothetical protein
MLQQAGASKDVKLRLVAHELGHAVVPPEYRRRGVIDPLERDDEGM